MSFTIDLDMGPVNAMLTDLGDEAEAAVRPAAYEAAAVMYRGVQRNVDRLGRKTGNLADSIYHAFSEDNSGEGYAEYHISWNHKKAPHGHLLEHGYIQKYKVYRGRNGEWYSTKTPSERPERVKGHHFVRNAYYANMDAALDAAEQELQRRLDLI